MDFEQMGFEQMTFEQMSFEQMAFEIVSYWNSVLVPLKLGFSLHQILVKAKLTIEVYRTVGV